MLVTLWYLKWQISDFQGSSESFKEMFMSLIFEALLKSCDRNGLDVRLKMEILKVIYRMGYSFQYFLCSLRMAAFRARSVFVED